MPEFYDQGTCKYQRKAQPYLAAIASGVRDRYGVTLVPIGGDRICTRLRGAPNRFGKSSGKDATRQILCSVLSGRTIGMSPASGCNCRINNSVSMEVDAIFFLESAEKNTLAVHVEMKLDREKLSVGQAEAYRPRAACFRDQRRRAKDTPASPSLRYRSLLWPRDSRY